MCSSDLGLERVILYIHPTIVVLLAVWLKGRPLRHRTVIALLVSYVGLAFCFAGEIHSGNPEAMFRGVAFVFADHEAGQRFTAGRYRRAGVVERLLRAPRLPRQLRHARPAGGNGHGHFARADRETLAAHVSVSPSLYTQAGATLLQQKALRGLVLGGALMLGGLLVVQRSRKA